MRENRKYHRQQGFALVLVLWLVALLTIVAASFSTHSKVETRLTGNAIDALHSRLLAQSGVNRAILELMVSDPQQRWNSNGQIYQIETDQGRVSISIRNSSGLLDLNKAPRDQLVKLLALIEDDIQEREALADRLIDWRDSDVLRYLSGAEDADYHSAGYPYGTAGRDLVSIDELAYVMGFNADRVERLRPYITLYSNTQNVDLRYAPEVLVSLLKGGLETNETLSEVLDYVDSDLADLELGGSGGQAAGADYRVWVEAVSAQGARTQLLVDIDLRSQDDAPYSIRSWHDSL
ncbi:general secretion pathway protein GspK [Candidatus Thiodiazotropha sp. CDECU1]|uniref:general secretion pathway protein GspK n=1 Tax=Candidatus Thiodiazotropha sp. CDECU1 TaxID=3065865 RepID=UPI002931C3D0|nr:PilX N-terminal domain-containing pilus assembly protein [Candidatus Thiodiazotropha sp. CDECU1]